MFHCIGTQTHYNDRQNDFELAAANAIFILVLIPLIFNRKSATRVVVRFIATLSQVLS
jgi:hypothetical protein